jgi:antitoxin component YwqK of YwqJK toxin-antitoxin module
LPRQYEDGEVGNRHEYKYDDNGNCIQEIVYNPGADTTTVAWSYSYSYVFDQSGRMIKKTTVNDNRSDSVVYEYDQNGKCIKATYENDSSVGGWSEHQWEYNEEGLLCRETVYNVGGLVFWWHEFEYDMNHRLIRETWHNVMEMHLI